VNPVEKTASATPWFRTLERKLSFDKKKIINCFFFSLQGCCLMVLLLLIFERHQWNGFENLNQNTKI